MKTQITTEYTTRRLPSSRNGNPRYELRTLEGLVIGSTRPDSGIAYGPVPNFEQRGPCTITIHETPTGRRYVESVEKLEAPEIPGFEGTRDQLASL